MDVGSPPAAPTTAYSFAYSRLRDRILSGDLAPGAPLLQAALAKEMSISMTPVREALRDLGAEGLVTQLPHRGTVVTSLDVGDAIEINEIRLRLEPDAIADGVASMTDDALNEAERLFDALAVADAGEWVAQNRRFHELLISFAPSRRARAILTSLAGYAALYVGFAMNHRHGPAPQKEHRDILDACWQRDPDAVREAVAAHIRHSLDSLREGERS